MRRSALLGSPGAIAEDAASPDAAVPAHYGNPLREQSALAEGQAITALARDVVAVSGPDRLSWLTTLTSQVLTGLLPGDGGAEALILDAHGRISHALAVVDDGATAWIVVDAGDGPALAEHLERMRFMLRVEVAPRDDVAILGAMGAGIAALEEAARAASPEDGGPTTGPGAEPEAGAAAQPLPSLPVTWRDPWPGVVDGGTSYDVGLETAHHPGEGYRAAAVLVPAERVLAIAPSSTGARGAAWPGPWPGRRCVLRRGAPAGPVRPTSAPSRTSSTGCAPRSTSTRAATRARRRWPAPSTSGARPAASPSCSSTASRARRPFRAPPCAWGSGWWAW